MNGRTVCPLAVEWVVLGVAEVVFSMNASGREARTCFSPIWLSLPGLSQNLFSASVFRPICFPYPGYPKTCFSAIVSRNWLSLPGLSQNLFSASVFRPISCPYPGYPRTCFRRLFRPIGCPYPGLFLLCLGRLSSNEALNVGGIQWHLTGFGFNPLHERHSVSLS